MTTLPEYNVTVANTKQYTVTVINNNGILQPSSTNPPTVTTQAVAVGANAVGYNVATSFYVPALTGQGAFGTVTVGSQPLQSTFIKAAM